MKLQHTMNKACFLDRDGVLIKEKKFLSNKADIEFIPEAFNALKLLKKYEFIPIVFTNQSGVAKGYFKESAIYEIHEEINKRLRLSNVEIKDFYYCPHHPQGIVEAYSYHCNCRKPNTELFLNAIKKYNIDVSQTFLIGDKLTDLLAAKNIGCEGYLVETGYGLHHKEEATKKNYKVFKDIYEAVSYYINSH